MVALVRFSISANASRDQYVVITISWMMMLVIHIATCGTLFAFVLAKALGMSLDLPAANITSAQISAQAR